MKPLMLGEPRAHGQRTCSFKDMQFGRKCDRRATQHFIWLKDKTYSLACEAHTDFIHARDTTEHPFTVHPFGDACGQDGSFIVVPDEIEGDSRCGWLDGRLT